MRSKKNVLIYLLIFILRNIQTIIVFMGTAQGGVKLTIILTNSATAIENSTSLTK